MNDFQIIQRIQQQVAQLELLCADLSQQVEILNRELEEKRFISDKLNQLVQHQLTEISQIQATVSDQYQKLRLGEIPHNISNLTECLCELEQNLSKKHVYLEAIKVFVALSCNEEMKVLMAGLVQEAERFDVPNMSLAECEKQLEKYILVQKCIQEADKRKKFSYIYEIGKYFGEEFAYGLYEGYIYTSNSAPGQQAIIDVMPEIEQSIAEGCDIIKAAAVEEVSEEHGNSQENLGETVQSESETEATEESNELSEKQTDTEISWEDLGISDPESLILSIDDARLTVEERPRPKKFSVKEFKKEIERNTFVLPPKAKRLLQIICLEIGASPEQLARYIRESEQRCEEICDKYVKAGYLKKCTLEGYHEIIYKLSDTGRKIFTTQESAKFIGEKQRSSDKLVDEYEDTADNILLKILRAHAYEAFFALGEEQRDVEFLSVSECGYFIKLHTRDKNQKKSIAFVSIISSEPKAFHEFKKKLEKSLSQIDTFIVVSVDREHAKALSEWVYCQFSDSFEEKPLWYLGYESTDCYNYIDDSLVINPSVDQSEADCSDEQITVEDQVSAETEDTVEETAFIDDMEISKVEEIPTVEKMPSDEGIENDEEDISDEIVTVEAEEIVLESDTKGHEQVSEVYAEKTDEVQDALVQTEVTIDQRARETQAEEKESVVSIEEKMSKESVEKCLNTVRQMLVSKDFYCATAYLKAISDKYYNMRSLYQRLAYALNDPCAQCNYNANQIIAVYTADGTSDVDGYMLSAALRNFFFDDFSYDYSQYNLYGYIKEANILQEMVEVFYKLLDFKKIYKHGIDYYADYRQKKRELFESKLQIIRNNAQELYDYYIVGTKKETISHKRALETRKLIFDRKSDLATCIEFVCQDQREYLEFINEFVQREFIREGMETSVRSIDKQKINDMLDNSWNMAGDKVGQKFQTSTLKSSLRQNLFKSVQRVAVILCDYVSLLAENVVDETDSGLLAYRQHKMPLITAMKRIISTYENDQRRSLKEKAEINVISATLAELIARLDGSYEEDYYRYYYIDFLSTDKVLLDEDYQPMLHYVSMLDELSAPRRIEEHYQYQQKNSCEDRGERLMKQLDKILKGQDDYGSAQLIWKYLIAHQKQMKLSDEDIAYLSEIDFEQAIRYPHDGMPNTRNSFIGDLELAQSYGQIDNTTENRKETLLQVMEVWYQWAEKTHNYGFFNSVCEAIKNKIKVEAQKRKTDLIASLSEYQKANRAWKDNHVTASAVHKVEQWIENQNYAAAEDQLNRLIRSDLEQVDNILEEDYLEQFLREYDSCFRQAGKTGENLKLPSYYNSLANKDKKGASMLLESWPKGANTAPDTLCKLLRGLGFDVEKVIPEQGERSKIYNYQARFKHRKNGKKENYKHPIAAFGSIAEKENIRVSVVIGNYSMADDAMSVLQDIGSSKNTIVLLDCTLTLPERRKLARLIKQTIYTENAIAVIDRTVAVFLANHYSESAINRMLMAIVMPFTYYQPYVAESSFEMPQEMFIGRADELSKIEARRGGVNIVYGGRQLGKSALLKMAKKDIDHNAEGHRAVYIEIKDKCYDEAAKKIVQGLQNEGILKPDAVKNPTDWQEIADALKDRLERPEKQEEIPFFLLLLDETDKFLESCKEINYSPLDKLKEVQETGKFKFVIAGLRNVVRFDKESTRHNHVFPHFESLTVKPFRAMEARELLEVPLAYLGFRFPKDNNTDMLISTIFGTTNYFPGLIQYYCSKLIEALKRDYAGYSEYDAPPYKVKEDHIKKILSDSQLEDEIRQKFNITLEVDEDDYYLVIALLAANYYHENKDQNGFCAMNILQEAEEWGVNKVASLKVEQVEALMKEMCEMNLLQETGKSTSRYRFARYNFLQMLGTMENIQEEILKRACEEEWSKK